MVVFVALGDAPALLAPGQRVRFHAIGADQFTAFAR
jgi:allophanate hydrolase subunit 1